MSTFFVELALVHLLREAKPGVSKPGGVPTFFGKGPDCVADRFRDCSS